MKNLTRALLIAALAAPLVASAQTAPTDTSKTGGAQKTPAGDTTKANTGKADTTKREKLTDRELQIVAHYHNDNLMEVDLGKLAGKRGANAQVKAYGEMLVKHHGDLDKQMAALVKKSGQAIPQYKPEAPADQAALASAKKRAADLQKLNGAAFDREYVSLMVDNHAISVASLDAHLAEVKSPELAQMLRDARPILQGHLDRARELQSKDTAPTQATPGQGTQGTQPAKPAQGTPPTK